MLESVILKRHNKYISVVTNYTEECEYENKKNRVTILALLSEFG